MSDNQGRRTGEGMLAVGLVLDLARPITARKALELFEKFHERPTEKVIRETA